MMCSANELDIEVTEDCMRPVSRNLKQQLCMLLFLKGREMLHGGWLWTNSRAVPSGMHKLQATVASASALPFCRAVFQTAAEPACSNSPGHQHGPSAPVKPPKLASGWQVTERGN